MPTTSTTRHKRPMTQPTKHRHTHTHTHTQTHTNTHKHSTPTNIHNTQKRHNPPDKLQTQTSRGRVLAEGDVDPAAGSRNEPTRLPVEGPVAERKQALRHKYTRSLFFKSNIRSAASPADPHAPSRTLAGNTFSEPQNTSKKR